ncbi:riboflavin synthase [Magnetovibrio sp. PR-2]|uniref:riboflavin synthase n=1 Tax=Magnetovibrio sp. PR-2 TaxID=3120356 RepID=UPI002FCE27EF
MFTGIVTDMGRVRSVSTTGEGDGEGRRFEIETGLDLSDLDIGASIAHAGACMTVVDKGADWYAIEVSAESLSKTTLGAWTEGERINLERAMRLGDELGGHMVGGHVDGVGEVVSREPEGDSVRFKFQSPEGLAKYLAPKGSITIDGVSLTVNEVEGPVFGINVIPHTQEVTTIGDLQAGDMVNLEIDMLARYVARLLGQEDKEQD